VSSEFFIFARFHAKEGQQDAVAASIHEVLRSTREEAGCLHIDAYGSSRDPRLFYVHSRWQDEAAFDHHAQLPHTIRFLDKVQPLIDHALDVNRTRPLR
jgi:quinol monooxygenase YgiN